MVPRVAHIAANHVGISRTVFLSRFLCLNLGRILSANALLFLGCLATPLLTLPDGQRALSSRLLVIPGGALHLDVLQVQANQALLGSLYHQGLVSRYLSCFLYGCPVKWFRERWLFREHF